MSAAPRPSELGSGTGSVGERGPQQVLGRVRRRPGGDRVGVGPVELAQAQAVEGDPGVVRRLLQLPGRLAEIHLALAGVVRGHRAAPLALVAGRRSTGATLLIRARYPAIRAVCERPRGVSARAAQASQDPPDRPLRWDRPCHPPHPPEEPPTMPEFAYSDL